MNYQILKMSLESELGTRFNFEGKEFVESEVIIEVRGFTAGYGKNIVVKGIGMPIIKGETTAIIGPSGSGKSTLLRGINRMNELIPDFWSRGEIFYHGQNLYDSKVDPVELRRWIGMVFQRPNPFPKSIYENVIYGPRVWGVRKKSLLKEIAEQSLRQAYLWDEVKDNLKKNALALSGGQQQRLCIARALAVEPEVLLMDEPCSSLDPIATAAIEELMRGLTAQGFTLVIVTHNLQQAVRVSNHTAFMNVRFDDRGRYGEVVEFGLTEDIFNKSVNAETADYVAGKFG